MDKMKRIIDVQSWNRKEHFEFFSSFDDPFFGIVSEIDCTKAYQNCKANQYSFFLYYLYQSLVAVNEIEEFRYRIDEGNVVCFDTISASSTIGREDGTFGYSNIHYAPTFDEFIVNANKEIEAVKKSSGIRLNDEAKRLDTIHYTSLPWFKLNSITHPRNFKYKDSVPKISFGKYYEQNGKKIMNVAINAHHGLMDGIHIGSYLKLYQKLMDE
jgi:chloramphenicol O-acetyltransferase type A